MKTIRIELGPFDTNCYLLRDDEKMEAVIIDPAVPALELKNLLENYKLLYILNTHGHFDHIGGNNFLKSGTHAPIVIHQADAEMFADSQKNLSDQFVTGVFSPPADTLIENEEFSFTIDGATFQTISTPGHSPGSVCFYCEEKATFFGGDLLFPGGIGRTDFKGGDFKTMKYSVERVLSLLPDETRIFPGHEDDFLLGDYRSAIEAMIR